MSAYRSPLIETLDSNGYVILSAFLTGSELRRLRLATSRTILLARSGQWPHLRTLPKQFPPWSSTTTNGIWGIQHLLHPSLPDSAEFARSYFSDTIIDTVKALLGLADNDGDDVLVMELYNLLITPDRNFELRWHRDDIPPSAAAVEELERLGKPAWHAQWNLALYDDESLVVVPGSHKRARTAAEIAAEPYEADMPGQKTVELKAGDCVFYNNNILHRGVYDSTIRRETLHGSIGHVRGSRVRARNVLQHGVGSWILQADFISLEERQKTRAESMRENLIKMGAKNIDSAFSQND